MSPNSIRAGDRVKPFQHAMVIVHEVSRDLKMNGLFDSTLVVWGGEYGRSPVAENGKGRDHHPKGFTMWMAGAGVGEDACMLAEPAVERRLGPFRTLQVSSPS